MPEKLIDILYEICGQWCSECGFVQGSNRCKEQIKEYEKRIREAINAENNLSK